MLGVSQILLSKSGVAEDNSGKASTLSTAEYKFFKWACVTSRPH